MTAATNDSLCRFMHPGSIHGDLTFLGRVERGQSFQSRPRRHTSAIFPFRIALKFTFNGAKAQCGKAVRVLESCVIPR